MAQVDVTVIQAVDWERHASGISPCVWDFEFTEESSIQDDTWKSWTNSRAIQEFKIATQSCIAVTNNFQR